MTQGYCVKCKKNVDISNAKESTTSRGTKIAKGKCPHCGTTVCRMGGLK
jgi:DNA-directed RNA polymerase subunit RPC12/RpoP